MRLVIIGPPGSGKGTQAVKIANKYALKHISTGELLRNEQEKETNQGKQIKNLISTGNFVPDCMINNLVKPHVHNNFVLDGYPRTLSQAKCIDFKIDLVIFLDLSDDECVERITKRNEGRADDNEETARKRIKIYMENTLPVVDFYLEKKILKKVNGKMSKEAVFEKICVILNSCIL